MRCELDSKHPISQHHITVDDEFLFRKIMYFCSWNCFRKWMSNNNFPIKKEKLFAIDIGTEINKIPNKNIIQE